MEQLNLAVEPEKSACADYSQTAQSVFALCSREFIRRRIKIKDDADDADSFNLRNL
ncbi:MAG: hypothetical protein KF770_13160 [Anaerolineae bacterium]|nr:hypothetical protein [Anaerolineae bacterium]